MHYTQTQQLPVPYDRVDESTFNPNLPNHNDVLPPIQIAQGMHEVAGWVVANFRMYAQSRWNKSPLHTFAYNMLSQNRFQNQLIQEWVQRAVDFAQYLIVQHRKAPADAIAKSAQSIYLGYLATIASHYPNVAQMCPQQMINGLIEAGNELNDINKDVAGFKQQGQGGNGYSPNPSGTSSMMGGSGGGHVTAPIQTVLSQYATTTHAHVSGNSNHVPAELTARRGSGMLLQDTPQPASNSWDARQPTASQSQPVQPGQGAHVSVQTQAAPQQSVGEELSLKELVIDPYSQFNQGAIIDPTRPYDEIVNPGGVVIKPAYQVKGQPGWQWQASEGQPYRVSYDHVSCVLFLAKWPSGHVKEIVVPATNKPEMEYLLHEINDDLRRTAIRPKGMVVALTNNIVDLDADARPLEEVSHELDEHLDEVPAMSPVIIERVLSGNTELEDEREARAIIREALGLDLDSDLPPHEYNSYRFHPMDITQECFELCQTLKDYKSFDAAANKLQNMLDNNVMPIRVFRFLDQRLTKAVNDFLADSMSITGIKITSFIADIKDMGPYLAKKRGLEYQKLFDSGVSTILGRYLVFGDMQVTDPENEEQETRELGLVEQFVNFQAGWTQQDMESLDISAEAKLISNYTHPRVGKVVAAMIKRASANMSLKSSRLRIITSDGVYYELIRGKLLEVAVLLKQYN